MITEVRSLQPLFLTLLLNLYEVGKGAYFRLYLIETDQVIELFVGVTLDGFVDNDTVAASFRTVLISELLLASTFVRAVSVDEEMTVFRT